MDNIDSGDIGDHRGRAETIRTSDQSEKVLEVVGDNLEIDWVRVWS